jgi:Lon-like protease
LVILPGDIIDRMTPKTAAMSLAGVALVLLVAIALLLPMPYVVMSPGLTENTLGLYKGKPVITIKGHRTYKTTGRLDLTTVSVTSPEPQLHLADVVNAWFDPNRMVIPRDVIYPPNQSVGQVEHQNTTEMLDSQSSAEAAGLTEAGIHAVHVTVAKVTPKAPADGVLHVGDLLVSVDGTRVDGLEQTVLAIRAVKPNTAVTLGLLRHGRPLTKRITTEPSPSNPDESHVGVQLSEKLDPPFKIRFNPQVVHDIGGPSAGMMFSLAIYDMLTPGALTGGRNIAGTGTISTDGTVGAIGGIQQKIAGAYRDGARIFLVPAEDCSEAVGSQFADSVELVKVSTLDDAVKALRAINSGHGARVARCSAD